MKRQIIQSDMTISLDVNISHQYVESAKFIGEGLLDNTTVLEEWISFVDQFKENINKDIRLNIVKEKFGDVDPHISTSVPISRYLYIEVADPITSIPIDNLLINFRISNHTSKVVEDESKSSRSKGEDEVREELSNSELEFIRGQIIVNNKTFRSYNSAMYGALASLEKSINALLEIHSSN